MRDPNNKLLRIKRGKRRSALIILLMSASPVLADSSTAQPTKIQLNPFCEGAQPTNVDEVHLASGRNQSIIRLKPIGHAIGLKSLDTTETQSSLPQLMGGSKMTIESIPSVVRINPLIDSVHHGDRELVDVDVAPAGSAGATARNQRHSTIMLMRIPRVSKKQASPVVEPLIGANQASQPSVPQLVRPAQRVEQEPVHFTLSDRSTSDRTSESRSEPKPEMTPKALVLEAAPAAIDRQVKLSEPASVDATASGISIIRSRGIKTSRKNRPKRYRLPVEVKSIPIEIERASPANTAIAPVEIVPAFQPGPVALVNASAVKPTKLSIDLAQARSLTLGGRILKVEVADTTVCKVIASGPQQLKLIGTGEGITQLVVLADGKELGQKPLQRTFQVHVTDTPQVAGHSMSETCELLNQSIRETFSGCEVMVVQRDNQLMVAGRCDSQSSAKKILRMVRSTCLVPVRDELIVQ